MYVYENTIPRHASTHDDFATRAFARVCVSLSLLFLLFSFYRVVVLSQNASFFFLLDKKDDTKISQKRDRASHTTP